MKMSRLRFWLETRFPIAERVHKIRHCADQAGLDFARGNMAAGHQWVRNAMRLCELEIDARRRRAAWLVLLSVAAAAVAGAVF